MKTLVLLLFASLAFVGFSQTTQTAKGFVFDDTNKNGQFDKGEKGVANVLVSNQSEVVKTDASGFYEIGLTDPSVLFVTKPSGYSVPLNEKNFPQFYYIYQPVGSPMLESRGIEPTGAFPEKINFPLIAEEGHADFKVLVMADVQAADETELGYFRDDVIAPALSYSFDLVLSLGDLIHENPLLYPIYINSMALLGKPFYNVLGNHDVDYDAVELYSDDSFKSFFGPEYYSFEYGNVHFVVLENIERFCKKGEVAAYWDCYRGKVSEKQLGWLKNDLANVPADKMVVVCQHIAFEKTPNPGERNEVVNMREVFDVLVSREKLLVLSGHKHTLQHDYFSENDGWGGVGELHQIVCSSVSGSWWTGPKDERGIPSTTQIDGVPNGYFILSFNGASFKHSFYPAGNSTEQMRIESPTGKVNAASSEIVVNVYNSNKHSTVVAIIDGKTEVVLKNMVKKDPFITNSFKEFRGLYKSWASPSESTQLWTGQLPVGLAKGFHAMNIKSTDEFGRSFTMSAVFETE